MLSFFKSLKKYIVIGVISVLTTGVFAYYLFYPGPVRGFHLPREIEPVRQDGKIKINTDTMLTQKIIYLKCNDVESYRTKVNENLIGLNISQLQKIYSGWTIDKFDTSEIEMSLKIDSFCREHANNMFIGLKDGYVAVFYGKPGNKPILKEVTKIAVSHLMPQDVEELNAGIVVQSNEELLRILEGMQSR